MKRLPQPVKFCLKLAVTSILLFLLYRRVDFAALHERLATLRLGWIAIAIALMASNTLVSSRKWQLLLRADSINIPLRSLFASHLIGSFFNIFLPSTIGGDVYRIADIGGRIDMRARTAASILADRITGFLALAIYGLAASLFVKASISNWSNGLLLLPTFALVALSALCVLLCSPSFVERCCVIFPSKVSGSLLKVLCPVLDSVQAYIRRPIICIRAIFLSFVFQFCAILAVYALARSVDLDLALRPFFFFVPLITLLEMIPISIFGIGLRDTGYVWFMSAVGRSAPQDDAALLAIVYVATTVIYVGTGGILFIFRGRNRKVTPAVQ